MVRFRSAGRRASFERAFWRAAWASVVVAACVAPSRVGAQVATSMSTADSAAIIHEAWQTVARDYSAFRRGAVSLWIPTEPDSARAAPISPAVRAALVAHGLPVSELRPRGDDTVVVALKGIRSDSAGVVVEFRSRWTTVRGTGTHKCRTASGNAERVRLRRVDDHWTAERVMPVIHGDNICVPIP